MAGDETFPAARATSVRWAVFGLAFGTSWLLYLHRYVFGFIKPLLEKEWGLSNTDLGKLDSAFSICYAVFQFPLGMLADLLGVHLVLSLLILLWCCGLAIMAWAPQAPWMWYGLATMGTGQSAVYACLSRIARTWFAPAIRTTLQGLVGVLAGRFGGLSASLILPSLLLGVLGFDWRTATWIFVGAGCVQLVLFVLVFRNSPRQHPWVNEEEARLIEGDVAALGGPASRGTKSPGMLALLSRMTWRSQVNLGRLGVQTILSTVADNIYSNWIPLFLAQVHALKFKEMGIYAALPLLGGGLGGWVGGMLNDYFIARTGNVRWSRNSVAIVGKGMAALLMFAALLFYDRPYVFCSLLFFVKFFGDWSLTSSLGVVTDISGKATASVFAFNNTWSGLAQFGAPLMFGFISQYHGWYVVFAVVGVTYVLCALSWLLIDSTILVIDEPPPQDTRS